MENAKTDPTAEEMLLEMMRRAEVGFTPAGAAPSAAVARAETSAKDAERPPVFDQAGYNASARLMAERIARDIGRFLDESGAPPPLSAMVLHKRIESCLAELRTVILPHANVDFRSATEATGRKTLLVDGAVLKRYTYARKYSYPAEICGMEARLKQAKTAAEESGAATPVPKTVSVYVDTLFTIAL